MSQAVSAQESAQQIIAILSSEVSKSLPLGWQDITSIQAAQTWLKERSEDSFFMSIHLRAREQLIGFLFLNGEEQPRNLQGSVRLGYLLSADYWGQGLGSETINGLLDWCKTQDSITALVGGVEAENIASIKLLEKCGFVPQVISPDSSVVDAGPIFMEYHFVKNKP